MDGWMDRELSPPELVRKGRGKGCPGELRHYTGWAYMHASAMITRKWDDYTGPRPLHSQDSFWE